MNKHGFLLLSVNESVDWSLHPGLLVNDQTTIPVPCLSRAYESVASRLNHQILLSLQELTPFKVHAGEDIMTTTIKTADSLLKNRKTIEINNINYLLKYGKDIYTKYEP